MKGQSQGPCPEDRFAAAASRSRSRAVEFLAGEFAVSQTATMTSLKS